MRKACIELIYDTKVACLVAGELGMGRYLLMVIVSKDIDREPTAEQWLKALRRCEERAGELKYEVAHIRGAGLAGL
ncbi:hypothetical protein [Serratia entomophila]|uniref:hypothetical protein n=1 Tax=Serratia entomophila TaxID=42906 RepID=UPI0021B71C93|nr:hypothetical protein [Serratia entomophila]